MYRRHNYINNNIDFLISHKIYYYDIEDAGATLLQDYLPKNLIENLDNPEEKLKRHVKIGKFLRDHSHLSKVLMDRFIDLRRIFIEANNIQNDEILSIKKDALFLIDKSATYTEFQLGECEKSVKFRYKNYFSSYFHLNGYEFYFRLNGILPEDCLLEIKGFGDSFKEAMLYHEPYFVHDLKQLFIIFETYLNSINGKKRIARFLKQYCNDYLDGNLPLETYREFHPLRYNLWKLQSSTMSFYTTSADIQDIGRIDTSYNYNFLVPLMKICI